MVAGRPALPFILLLFLLAPVGAATQDATPQAQFVAASVSLGSDVGAQARFVGLRAQDTLTGSSRSIDPLFQVQGHAVEITMDKADNFVQSPVVGSPLPPTTLEPAPSGVTTRVTSYGEASLQGTASRSTRFLYVVDDGFSTVRLQTACSTVRVNELEETLTAPSVVNSSRESERRDISSALVVVACPGREMTVSGSFTIILWEWDFTVTSEGRTEQHWTGLGESAPIDARPYFGEAQQAFIAVKDGSFTIRGETEEAPRLFLEDIQLEASRLGLSAASGSVLAVADDVQGDLLELRGNMKVGLQRAPGGVGVTVFSGLKTLFVDGKTITLPTTITTSTQASLPTWSYILAAGLAGAVPLAVVPVVVRRKKEALIVHREDTEHLVQGHRLEEALPSSVRLVESMPRDPGANLLLATSMRRLGHSGQALGHLSRAREPGWLKPLDAIGSAELDLEAALSALDLSVGEADPVQAAQWRDMARNLVRRAVQADRGVLLDLEAYPGLDALYWETEAPQ